MWQNYLLSRCGQKFYQAAILFRFVDPIKNPHSDVLWGYYHSQQFLSGLLSSVRWILYGTSTLLPLTK